MITQLNNALTEDLPAGIFLHNHRFTHSKEKYLTTDSSYHFNTVRTKTEISIAVYFSYAA